jgi:hypothetical protein
LNTIKSNRIPHISPKKVTKFTTIKKGLDIIGHLKKEIGESDPDPNPFLVLGL